MKKRSLQATLSVLLLFLFAPVMSLHADNQLPSDDPTSLETDFQIYAKDPKKLKELIGMVQMALGTFGYGARPFDGIMDKDTTTALQHYQKNRGLKETTMLDGATVKLIFADLDVLRKEIPYLPPFSLFLDTWDRGYVRADGTWAIEQDEMAFPIQTTRIQCHRESKECVTATAKLSGKIDYLSSDIDTYAIERWDRHEIVTVPIDYECVRYTLRIIKAQKSVTASRIKTNDKGLCKDIAPELRLRMEDGSKIYQKLSNEREDKMKRFMRVPFVDADRDK